MTTFPPHEYLHRPEYDRDYDSSKVGDPQKLPRGKMTLRNNPDFYRSVHLAGVENARLQKEAAEKEKVISAPDCLLISLVIL